MNKRKENPSKQKIIETASDLFYRQGYLATGINQIIAEAGISKNTFYYYFPSKDDLCLAYLQAQNKGWIESAKENINTQQTPYDRLLAPLDFLESFTLENNCRGCPFLNIATEITERNSEIRKEVISHKDGFRKILEELLAELKKSNPKYSKLDVPLLADTYYVLFEGAIVACQNYGDTWPIQTARMNLEKLLL